MSTQCFREPILHTLFLISVAEFHKVLFRTTDVTPGRESPILVLLPGAGGLHITETGVWVLRWNKVVLNHIICKYWL